MPAYELPRFSIAGALEPPAYDIGGDTFDYAVSAQQLTVLITDAGGHGLRAAMLSSLTVSAIRNARRCGFPILDQARTANWHLSEQFAHPEFVTGPFLQLEVPTGHGGAAGPATGRTGVGPVPRISLRSAEVPARRA